MRLVYDTCVLLLFVTSDLKPRQASAHIPGLPAYILFMCIRHTDYMNDDDKVRSLLSNGISSIKKIVKKKQEDVEVISVWLANTCRLLHNLKQYSGEKVCDVIEAARAPAHQHSTRYCTLFSGCCTVIMT